MDNAQGYPLPLHGMQNNIAMKQTLPQLNYERKRPF